MSWPSCHMVVIPLIFLLPVKQAAGVCLHACVCARELILATSGMQVVTVLCSGCAHAVLCCAVLPPATGHGAQRSRHTPARGCTIACGEDIITACNHARSQQATQPNPKSRLNSDAAPCALGPGQQSTCSTHTPRTSSDLVPSSISPSATSPSEPAYT